MLLFVYAGLASVGGTVPVQALPVFLHALGTEGAFCVPRANGSQQGPDRVR